MNTITTINQIVKLFKDLANDHLQIIDFGYGELYDLYTSRNVNYPLMYLTNNDNNNIVLSNNSLVNEISFSIYVCDLVNDSENVYDVNGHNSNNGQEVLSDTFTICLDIIDYMLTSIEFRDLGIVLLSEDDVVMSASIDELTDKVNGWLMTFTLRVKYKNCDIPFGE